MDIFTIAGLAIVPIGWLLLVYLERGGQKSGKTMQALGMIALAVGAVAASAFWLLYMV
jgi:hypothetical protein